MNGWRRYKGSIAAVHGKKAVATCLLPMYSKPFGVEQSLLHFIARVLVSIPAFHAMADKRTSPYETPNSLRVRRRAYNLANVAAYKQSAESVEEQKRTSLQHRIDAVSLELESDSSNLMIPGRGEHYI